MDGPIAELAVERRLGDDVRMQIGRAQHPAVIELVRIEGRGQCNGAADILLRVFKRNRRFQMIVPVVSNPELRIS